MWFYAAGVVALILGATEVGFWVGRRHRDAGRSRHERFQVSTLQAATLGLLGLLLAFTLSMAEERFSGRRAVIVEDANAIGTSYLRALFLPDAERVESRALLRQYTNERVAFYDASGNEEEIRRTSERSEAILDRLWMLAVSVGRANPESEPVKLYVASLNATIDLESKRVAILYATLPKTIVALLLLVAVIAVGFTGYSCGLSGRRGVPVLYIVPPLIALACCVVLDLSHPRVGLIRAGDVAMERLQQSMRDDVE